MTATELFDPACVIATTGQQLLARHSRMDGDNRKLALLEDMPRRRPDRALSAIIERRVGERP